MRGGHGAAPGGGAKTHEPHPPAAARARKEQKKLMAGRQAGLNRWHWQVDRGARGARGRVYERGCRQRRRDSAGAALLRTGGCRPAAARQWKGKGAAQCLSCENWWCGNLLYILRWSWENIKD
jgi:hypothetical protein